MSLTIYFGWGLLLPVVLSLVYGFIAQRAMGSFGCPQGNTFCARIWITLPPLLLITLWSMAPIPLPVVYILLFLGKLSRLLLRRKYQDRGIFIINFIHLLTIALHMILIGIFSLAVGLPMNELLQQPLWRIISVAIVLVVNILADGLLPRWHVLLSILRTQSRSEEIQPFVGFLWFCNFFLLMDSVLCITRIDWKLLPVFLIGSTVLLEFYLIRFLWHLYAVLKVRYLEEENRNLMKEMEERNRTAEELRSRSTMDGLTGIYSRRYVMEQMTFLLQSKESFSLVFIDLDHLKLVNDRQGHQAGDLHLSRFAREFGTRLEDTDIFARVGGDEFAVLILRCTRQRAEKRIEEIRTSMEKECIPAIPFSYGITFVSQDHDDSLEEVFRRADHEMYRDKQQRTEQ